MKVILNNALVEITPQEVQALINGSVGVYNGRKDAEYPIMDLLDRLVARLKTDRALRDNYNETATGD